MDLSLVLWFVIIGLLLVAVGTVGRLLQRLWLSTSVVYLGIGLLMSPLVLNLLNLDLIRDAKMLEHLTEVAVIISLFGAGMKMRMPLRSREWIGPLILAFLTMIVTVGLTTAIGYWMLGLPLGIAVLLGAVLGPTDPVLAGEVQLEHPDDKDRLRLLLTGEAGFNDGTAFPFVLLAVGLAGIYAGQPDLHPLGNFGWKWIAVDVLWRIVGGVGIGFLLGHWLGKVVIWLRKQVTAGLGADEMLTLGFIALVYGVGLATYTYAFLAVFAAAVASRRLELAGNEEKSAEEAVKEADEAEAEQEADAPEHAEAMLARSGTLVANTMERLVEVLLVVMVGAMLGGIFTRGYLPAAGWWFVPLLLLVVRPVSVYATLHCRDVTPVQRAMVAWFGIRGIGTLYYFTHAMNLGLLGVEPLAAKMVADLCLITIAVSVIAHGISVSPLMGWYGKRCEAGKSPEPASHVPRPSLV